jgi:hypothetical protein
MNLSDYQQLIVQTRSLTATAERCQTRAWLDYLREAAASLQAAECQERGPADVQLAQEALDDARALLVRAETKGQA